MLKKLLAFSIVGLGAFVSASAQTEEQDSISLSLPTYDMLDEVVIEAERPVLQSDGAKTTYNVDEDPAAASSTALDILRKVPMVSIDGEGTIRLNGETNYKLQVNGQENPMLQQYADRILQAMPASAIAKIEVITEPGAKADAEGTAGIINIITERTKSQDGFSGNVSLKASNRNFGPSLYGIMKKGNITLSANVDYQWGFAPQKSRSESTNRYLTGENPGTLLTTTSQEMKFQYVGGNINLSWEPNKNNLFTVGANIFGLNGSMNNILTSNRRFDNAGNLLWSYGQDGDGSLKIFNISANASYRHNFKGDTNYLIFSYLLNFGRNNLTIDQRETEDMILEGLDIYNYRNNKSYNRGHTFQLDYANNFSSNHHLMEVGAKAILRYNSANSLYYTGNTSAGTDSDPDNQNIDQPQDIYAGYASYTGTFGPATVVGGLRYEHTRMGIRYPYDPKLNFTTCLNDWVPNAAVTWSITPTSNLRAAYQMRISRPSIEQVNPFELALTPFDIRKGNPGLESERSNKVSLTYTNFGRVFGGNIGVEYTRIDNAISGFTYLRRQGDVNVVITSFDNVGKTDDIFLTGFLNWNIISHMSLSVNGRIGHTSLRAPAEGFKNKGWTGNVGGAWNYTVNQVYKFSAFGAWFGKRVNLQGHNSGFYYYGLSAGRDFLSDKSLNVTLSGVNFAQKSMDFKSYTATPDLISNTRWRNMTAWNVSVSVTWKFGSLNAQVKKTGVDIDNDDINKASNQNQGSSMSPM